MSSTRRPLAERLAAALALALALAITPDPEFAMASDALTHIDAVRIAYHGPQDKPVPPLFITAAPPADAEAVVETLGLTRAEDAFGMLLVTVDATTMASLAELTATQTTDATGRSALLSASVIDMGGPAARTATLSKSSASAYLTSVAGTARGKPGADDIAAWIARTNLVKP